MSPTAERTYGSRRGVTLIEMLVAMAIFIAIISSVMLMFTSVTNTVRRSYRTMDVYEQARNSLLALERDVKVSFTAPAAGADLQFYGEPYGFTLIGISPDQDLGRLTYVVHRDTSRMTGAGTSEGRGEIVTLMRRWDELAQDDPSKSGYYRLSDYYDLTEPYVDFQVEVIHGLLLRYYERGVTDMADFPRMDRLLQNPAGGDTPWMPRPYLTIGAEGTLGTADRFPWLSSYLWDYLDPAKTPPSAVSVPWYIRERVQMAEECHYWLQLLQGPGVRPIRPWDLMNIWWMPPTAGVGLLDQFWFDNVFWEDFDRDNGVIRPEDRPFTGEFPNPNGEERPILWDHVVARDFVLETYLLNPANGEPIRTLDGHTVPVLGPNPYSDYADENADGYIDNPLKDPPPNKNFDPIFRYAVENADNRATRFNTLYNLNYEEKIFENGVIVGTYNEFRRMSDEIQSNKADPDLDLPLAKVMEARQFYDLGSPLQARMPASFDVTFWVLNEPGVSGAPPDLYRFSQTVHLPTGYMRRSRAVN